MFKKRSFFCFFILTILFCSLEAKEWKELKGEHFIIYYFKEYTNFTKEVLAAAEDYYVEIAQDLGYERYSEFWLWDKRVKIYIYPDHKSYLQASHQPSWSHGMADYKGKYIMSYFKGKGFLNSILPHEIAHLMFRDFVGFHPKGNSLLKTKDTIPLWLDEGVAQWAEKRKRKVIKRLLKDTVNKGTLLSLKDIMNMDIRNIKYDDRVYIRYTRRQGKPTVLVLSGESLINLYYLEAVSLVGFLIEQYGAKRFTEFCRQLRSGSSVEESIKQVYPHFFKSIEGLERAWERYYGIERKE